MADPYSGVAVLAEAPSSDPYAGIAIERSGIPIKTTNPEWFDAKPGDIVSIASIDGGYLRAHKLDNSSASKVERVDVYRPMSDWLTDNPAKERPPIDVSQDYAKGSYTPGVGGALARAGLSELPAAAAGAAAMGQAMNATEGLRQSPFMPARVVGTMGPLAYGALAAMTASGATKAVLPEATRKQLEEDARNHPIATLAGSTAAQLPFFRPGALEKSVSEFIGARAPAAAIGAGIAGERELAGGWNDESLKNVAIAGLTNAALNKPTQLGESMLNIGNSKPITSKLGNASRKDTIVEGTAAANEIAMMEPASPTLPAPPSGIPTDAGTIAALSDRIAAGQAMLPNAPVGGPPAVAAPGAGKFIPEDLTFPRGVADAKLSHDISMPVPIEERAAVLKDLTPVNPADQTLLADLIKPGVKEGKVTTSGEQILKVGDAEYAKVGGEWYRATGEKVSEDTILNVLERKSTDNAYDKVSEPAPVEKVDIGKREPDSGTGVPNAREVEMLKEQKRLADEYLAAQNRPVPPISSPNEAPAKAETPIEPQKPVKPTETTDLGYVPEEPKTSSVKTLPSGDREITTGGKTFTEASFPVKDGKDAKGRPVRAEGGWLVVDKPMSSERGAVLNPIEIAKAASEQAGKALDKVNEPILQRMATTDVQNTNPSAKPLSTFDSFIGKKPEEVKSTEPSVAFPKYGEGRGPSKLSAELNKGIRTEIKASEKSSEAIRRAEGYTPKKLTKDEIWEMVKKDAESDGRPTPPEHVASEIDSAPEPYKPFLTDLAARFPILEKIPLMKETSSVIGAIAKVGKEKLGLLDQNIKEHSPRAFGALHQKIYNLNRIRIDLSNRADQLGKDAREFLTTDQWKDFQSAAFSGDRARAEEIIAASKNPAKLTEALDAHQQVMDELAVAQRSEGREVPEGDFYFHRRLVDRDGLLKHLGSDGVSTYNDALKAAAREKGIEVPDLTVEDKDTVLNNLISGSIRNSGKPGYLKPRTIETIEKDMLKFYEPLDVATHDYVMSTTRDISNRQFFGKTKEGEVPDWKDEATPIGRIIREEVQSERLDERGFKAVTKALGDYFNNSVKYDKDMASFANKVRKIQTNLYLADISSTIPQFADILVSTYNYGPKASAGFFNRKFSLEGLNVHEGINQDLSDFRQSAQKPEGSILNPVADAKKVVYYAGKAYSNSLRYLLGKADAFNKGGMANSAYKWVNDVVSKPDSAAFDKLNKQYSEMFPEKWPDMLKSLQSEDFKNGKLDDNSKFFLFNELMSLQPLDPAGRAQGYNQASPWGKALYTLRGYALTQLNILRRDAYDNLKSGSGAKAWEGLGNLALYGALVGVGQQLFSVGRDIWLNRKDDASEYAVGGLLQLMMIPRFAVYKAKEDGPLEAGLQTLIPGLSAGKDIWNDTQLGLKMATGQKDKTGRSTVSSFADVLRESRTTQYLPGVGREVYWWAGRGSETQKQNADRAAQGKTRPSTMQTLSDIFAPPDLKTEKR